MEEILGGSWPLMGDFHFLHDLFIFMPWHLAKDLQRPDNSRIPCSNLCFHCQEVVLGQPERQKGGSSLAVQSRERTSQVKDACCGQALRREYGLFKERASEAGSQQASRRVPQR